MKSDKPFSETLGHLLDMAGMSQRELGRRAVEHGWDRGHPALWRRMQGRMKVTPDVVEIVAAVLKVSPETFAEYRLWQARRQFEPEEIGWQEAIRNLRALEGEAEQPHSPAAVAQALQGRAGNGGKAASS